ncbi:MAG: hypothetical protein VYA30_15555 [Myxococcota bacterium]|nr:hypothetical protein [Myxococcota bacterium]
MMIAAGFFGCTNENSSVGSATPTVDAGFEMDGTSVDGDSADATSNADMMTQTGDGGTGEPATCDSICDRFVDCADDVCPSANAIVLRAACRMSCAAQDDFIEQVSLDGQCADIVSAVSERSPAIADRCGSEMVAMNPICDDYVALAGRCFADVCPNAGAIGSGVDFLFGSICASAVQRGDFEESQLSDLADAECNNILVTSVLGFILAEEGPDGSGGLVPLCSNGPVNSEAVCDAACQQLDVCIPEDTRPEDGGGFGDYPTCRFLCGAATEGVPSTSQWNCVSEQNQCGDVFACFDENEPPPRLESCRGLGDQVQGCIADTCPASARLEVGVREAVSGLCEFLVDNNTLAEADVAAAVAQNDCGSEMATGFTTYFTIDSGEMDGSGALINICLDMPENDYDVCDAACAALVPCLPDRNPLATNGVCPYFCAVAQGEDAISSQSWACLTETDSCEQVNACFE